MSLSRLRTEDRANNEVISNSSSQLPSRAESPIFDPQGSLILRIKRKRGVDPITALRIETERINNESNESREDLSNLIGTSPEDVTQTRPKRRLTDRGIFRLAETVSLSSFDSAEQKKELENRIARIKSKALVPPSTTSKKEENVKSSPVSSEKGNTQLNEALPSPNPSQMRFKVITSKKKSNRKSLFDTLKANGSQSSFQSKQRQRKTSNRADRMSESIQRNRPTPYTRPPRYIDAVVEGMEIGSKGKNKTVKSSSTSKHDDDMNSLDRRFAGLLGDYLKDQDLEPPKDILNAANSTNDTVQQKVNKDSDDDSSSDDDDYVYDIYYRDKEPAWGHNSAASAAEIGLQPSEVAGHKRELSYSMTSSVPNLKSSQVGPIITANEPMATLVGLSERDFFDDEDEETIEQGSRLISEELLDSDDPYEEGEDEDSNDEGFYRNDYPEQDADEDDDQEWGWSGPRRHGQRGSDEESDGDDDSF